MFALASIPVRSGPRRILQLGGDHVLFCFVLFDALLAVALHIKARVLRLNAKLTIFFILTIPKPIHKTYTTSTMANDSIY